MAGVIDVQNMVNHREVQEVAPIVVRESEEVRLRRVLEMAELVMDDRRLEVNDLSTRLQELRRQAERLEERAENEKRRRKEEHEMFVEKLRRARSAVSAEQLLTEKHKQENLLLAKDLGRLRWAISQSQVEVIENDPTSVEEVILAHLCAGEVKETEIVMKSDGKMRLSVLVALNGATRHLTAFATSEDGDYYRGRPLPNQWSEDRWIGDRDGIELKFGDLRVTNFGDMRRLPFSLLDTIRRSLQSSACFSGLADMEKLQIELLEKGVAVPS
ncbi:hypothetical protein ANCCAN_07601 [Ancylostoma caninum]|uniref:Uncharacterized protein n=1 Tax=Ancylostoma caninum TaxID=29170 RepID=A0A368GPX0_ANCCA|nr:hypothetical protein ANCCAN_07601 [Ancylostoma caninum]